MATPQMQRSVPEVLQDIVGNLQEIIRSEFLLAKAELKEEASKAAKPVATFGVGVALGFYGIGFLLLAAVYGLSTMMAGWLAALLVGAILAIVAIVLMSSSGKKLKRVNPTPGKTMRSLEENLQWAKHPIK
jgi:Putative Actinobacterial Holin-X, holin superfamily III